MDFIISSGYWGMLLCGFLTATFFPFSSEAVLIALLGAGLNPTKLLLFACIGNVAGGLTSYAIGRIGNLYWIEKYLHVKREKLNRAQRFMAGHGAWIGFFSFIPVLGCAITISLGLIKANIPISMTSISLGKIVRYVVLVYGYLMI